MAGPQANDFYAMLFGDDPEAKATAAETARLLRGQRLAALSGALASKNANATMTGLEAGFAKQDQDLQEKALVARAHYGQQAQDAKMNALRMTLEARAREGEANRQSQLQRDLIRAQGAMARAAMGANAKKGSAEEKLHKVSKAEYDKLIREWDPAQAVRSAFGQSEQQNLNTIRALALAARAAGPNGRVNLNTVQQAELAAMAGRIATGGVPTLETMKHFDPGAAQKTIASIQSFMTGKPVTTGMTEWADSFLKMLEGEGEAAQNYVRSTRLKNAERFRRYADLDPESGRRFLSNMGMDKPHPRGYIDPETFEVRNFDPNASARDIATGTSVAKVTSDAEYDALPSGTVFVGPDGKQRRKP